MRPLACWGCGFESRPGTWISVSCECCVLSGRGLCEGPIRRPEESYRVWCVYVSLSFIKCKDNSLRLQRLGRKTLE